MGCAQLPLLLDGSVLNADKIFIVSSEGEESITGDRANMGR